MGPGVYPGLHKVTGKFRGVQIPTLNPAGADPAGAIATRNSIRNN